MENTMEMIINNFNMPGAHGMDVDGSLALKEEDTAPVADNMEENAVITEEKDDAPVNVVNFDKNKTNDASSTLLRAGDVAKRLGITMQTVRNYAGDIQEYLTGRVEPSGERLYTDDDVEMIGRMYRYCKSKGVTRKAAKEILFNSFGGSMENMGSAENTESVAMDRMYEKLDELSNVIRTLSDTLLLQNGIISDLKGQLAQEKSSKEEVMKAVRSSSDSIKSYVGESIKKTKAELEEKISASAGFDASELKNSIDDTKNLVKGMTKVVNRIESKYSENADNSAIAELIRESEQNIIKALLEGKGGESSGNDGLLVENEMLKAQIEQLKVSAKADSSSDELEAENKKLKADLEKTLVAMRNMNTVIERLESEKQDISEYDALVEKHEKLTGDFEKTLEAMRNMKNFLDGVQEESIKKDEKIAEMEKTIEGLTKENEKAKLLVKDMSDDEINDIYEENEELLDEIDELEEKYISLQEKYEESLKKIDELNTLVSSSEAEEPVKEKKVSAKKAKADKKAEKKEKAKKAKGEKKSLFSLRKKAEPADLLPDGLDEDNEDGDDVNIYQIQRSARKVPVLDELPDVDEEVVEEEYEHEEEYHDEIEELPTDLFGCDDVEIDDEEVFEEVRKKAEKKALSKKKTSKKMGLPDEDAEVKTKKKKKGLFGIF